MTLLKIKSGIFHLLLLPLFVNCYQDRVRRKLYTFDEESVQHFLCSDYEKKASDMCKKAISAEWNYLVDVTNKTKGAISVNASIESARLDKDVFERFLRDVDLSTFESANLVRQVKRLSMLGNSALEDEKLGELNTVIGEMTEIYSTAKICPFNRPKCNVAKEGLSLDPDIESIMANSRDFDELLYTWVTWRENSAAKIKPFYLRYVELSNDAAIANNFTDKGEMWRYEFEWPNMEHDLEILWKQLEPLYNQLHKYVYNKLKFFYQKEMEFVDDDLVPAHILGNMWGQNWLNIRDIVKPFPEIPDIDVTALLTKANYNSHKMFETANNFYTSLGLPSMTVSFDTSKGAIIEKPKNKTILCHASAWDFCDKKDFRIKMCAKTTHQDFITIHHEMGHIMYYMLYSHLPIAFRAGANPGFHEAIGDTIALSVANPKHLVTIGLLDCYNETTKSTINFLMDMALERVAFLPYAYILDRWRWDVFSEKVSVDQWNDHYWNYRKKYQKVKPPIPRTDSDFDAASKFHVAGDAQYVSYFVAHILEFQIHKAMCVTTGQYQRDDPNYPLHNCDIYTCRETGQRFKKGLSLGASKHWTYVLETLTGERQLSVTAILEYFKPLYHYLVRHNEESDK